MNRAAYLAPLLLLGASMWVAAGDKDIIRSAIHSAVESKPHERSNDSSESSSSNDTNGSSDSLPKTIAEQAIHDGRHRNRHNGYYDTVDCVNLMDCPLPAPGSPEFAEVRQRFRHFTDSDLWSICTAQRMEAYGYMHDVACALIASPDPWRPVETPHDVESGEPLPTDEYDLDVVLDETALPPCKADDTKQEGANDTLARKRPKRSCKPPAGANE